MENRTWVSVDTELPPEGKYVFARHNKGTWRDGDDQENVNCVVVKLVRGLSQENRKKMESGELPTEVVRFVNGETALRHRVFRSEDEGFNNLRPYNWATFGPDSFFGQHILEWMEIPPSLIPEKYITEPKVYMHKEQGK